MKKLLVFFAVIAIFVTIFSINASADSGGYTITNFDFKGTVHENNTVSVTETIDVDFYEARHGIYRAIPLTMYVGGAAADMDDTLFYRNYVTDINVRGYEFEVEEEDDYCYIKIGSENKLVDGNQQYVVSYTYTMPDDRLDLADFFFYSVLGSQTGVSIDNFTFNVKFDKEIPKDSCDNLQVFSGATGVEENALGVECKVTENNISGEVSNVPAYNAVTLFTKLPNGYFVGAKTVSPVPMCVLFALLICVVIASIILAVKTKHNEPVETVEFYPPNGISPAEVGTIIDESADDIDLMSLIPWWAQKGYITLEEVGEKRKKHLVLHRNNSLPENVPIYQKKLFSAFFENGNTCDLKDLKLSFAERFKESKASLKGVFSGDKRLSVGHGKSILMVILTTLALFSTLAFSSVVSTFENAPFAILAAVPMMFLALITLSGFRNGFRNLTGKIVGIILSVICLIVSLFATYICSIDCVLPMYVPFIALALSIVSYLFSARIITDTDYRVEMLGKLLGLKSFIETAELDRLKMMMEENPYYYYDVLPYAMVFGLVDKWAKAFTNIKVDVPYWYTGYDTMTTWQLLYLNRMLHSNIREPISRINAQAAAKAAASAAANSSSGGFSGGGGGGGGIGSW